MKGPIGFKEGVYGEPVSRGSGFWGFRVEGAWSLQSSTGFCLVIGILGFGAQVSWQQPCGPGASEVRALA